MKNRFPSYVIKGLPFGAKLVLPLILLTTLLIQLIGLDYGLPYHYYPDEIYVEFATDMLKTGDLNPHWFGHPGSFIIYSLAFLYAIITGIAYIIFFFQGRLHQPGDFQHLMEVHPLFYESNLFFFYGRLLMVIWALVAVWLTYKITKKLFTRPAGWMAALTLSISPLFFLHSRMIRPDIAGTMCLLISIYLLVRFWEKPKEILFLYLSAWVAGFAVAAKYTFCVFALTPAIYALLEDIKEKSFSIKTFILNTIKFKSVFARVLLIIFLGFFLFAPYFFADFANAWKDCRIELKSSHLGHDRLPLLQNYIWYTKTVFIDGIGGLFFFIFALIGIVPIARRKPNKKYWLILAPVLYVLLVIHLAKLRFARYFIPLLAFESMLFGIGYFFSFQALAKQKFLKDKKWILYIIFGVTLTAAAYSPLRHNIRFASFHTRADTRTLAKGWIFQNFHPDDVVVYEYYGPHLNTPPTRAFTTYWMGWQGIAFNPLSVYLKNGANVFIVSGSFKTRYLNEPQKYPKQNQFYHDLEQACRLVKVFSNKNNPGPVIEIYRLKE